MEDNSLSAIHYQMFPVDERYRVGAGRATIENPLSQGRLERDGHNVVLKYIVQICYIRIIKDRLQNLHKRYADRSNLVNRSFNSRMDNSSSFVATIRSKTKLLVAAAIRSKTKLLVATIRSKTKFLVAASWFLPVAVTETLIALLRP
ncbi:hypothetical protein TNCV_152031 [Trichonephila clavipes]|uniref:Uncharacterized protein n=1 Tax=Trichonephila clavipes TaxID=2585209 RepID=A0A8X6RIW9_TRICX|nr:hypothetical protein TNCV_152031 [Trichonephila clavipes]